jgi:hypothetical protein
MANVQPLGSPQGDRGAPTLDIGIGPARPGVLQQTDPITNTPLLERLVQLFQEMDRQDHTAKILSL